METLESSRVCRLCGQHSGICINIFDKNETHVKKINAVLPILVHEMDLLPKQMCHRCSYKLEEFHKFYSDCLKTDLNLKSQLSWMRKKEVKEQIRVPMVQIENVRIKSEPPDYDIYELDPIVENVNYINSMSSIAYSMSSVGNNNELNSRRINDIDERLTCANRFADCSHCKYNYDKNNSTNEEALSINRTNNKSKHDVIRDSSSRDTGGSSRLNTFQNRQGNRILNGAYKAKKRYSKEENGINVDNILNTDEVKEIKIKTEKPDIIERRSLRPRKKSVDYLGTKRKKPTVFINPANVSKSLDAKRKSTAKQNLETVVNGIAIREIKKEPVEEIQSRTLRPRRFLVNYLGSKRKKSSCARIEPQSRSKNEEVDNKRYKSSNSFKTTSSFGSGKRFTGLISNPNEFKIKEEIISDDEMLSVGENVETRSNGIVKSCVRNLSNLFKQEAELAIKLEDNFDNEFSDPDWETTADGSRATRRSKSLAKLTTSKFKSRKLTAKRISDPNCSPKYLRSQDLRLRNGKVKKSASDKQISIKNLKKRIVEMTTTGRKPGRNLSSKIKDNVKLMKVVPAGLKIPSNIKHFCEKCCTSYMNKELYMLHACYFD